MSMGLGKITKRDRHGEQRKIWMIWDSIDLIMPLQGLLALSCLDHFGEEHTC